VRLVIF
jgi:hypothetical protein